VQQQAMDVIGDWSLMEHPVIEPERKERERPVKSIRLRSGKKARKIGCCAKSATNVAVVPIVEGQIDGHGIPVRADCNQRRSGCAAHERDLFIGGRRVHSFREASQTSQKECRIQIEQRFEAAVGHEVEAR